jgi:hypothetical protein
MEDAQHQYERHLPREAKANRTWPGISVSSVGLLRTSILHLPKSELPQTKANDVEFGPTNHCSNRPSFARTFSFSGFAFLFSSPNGAISTLAQGETTIKPCWMRTTISAAVAFAFNAMGSGSPDCYSCYFRFRTCDVRRRLASIGACEQLSATYVITASASLNERQRLYCDNAISFYGL